MRTEDPIRDPVLWLLRAEQARRIAAMLSGRDAQVAEAYARECEAKAKDPVPRPSPKPAVPKPSAPNPSRRPLAA